MGTKVSRITGLADDIKLNMAAADIRIEAPIPGKAAVGIEVPNKENSTVALRDLLESKEFVKHPSGIAFAAGRDIAGQVIVADIAKMPHLLIAGATGSGKPEGRGAECVQWDTSSAHSGSHGSEKSCWRLELGGNGNDRQISEVCGT